MVMNRNDQVVPQGLKRKYSIPVRASSAIVAVENTIPGDAIITAEIIDNNGSDDQEGVLTMYLFILP